VPTCVHVSIRRFPTVCGWPGVAYRCGMVDPGMPVPLWEQVANLLRARISAGELTGRVPSIRTLSQQYEVSTRTAERALTYLRDEGVLVVLHGRGYFVAR
jgi:GntR family transcriptional regulator